MLVKQFGSIKMGEKEKVKYLNKKFNRILNKFPWSMQLYDSISIDYYTDSLPTNISQFVKRVEKVTLSLNFGEVVVVKKDLLVIGVIMDDDE